MTEEPDASVRDVSRALSTEARQRMLGLVTRSFCRELVDYGVGVRDLLKVSSHVVEFASLHADRPPQTAEDAFRRFSLVDVGVDGCSYRMGTASIREFSDEYIGCVARWVNRDDIRNSLLTPYPTSEADLTAHLEADDCAYHLIFLKGEPAGLIGAEGIDTHSRRVEMRKFIGEPSMRGRGLGTAATFLWLHHAFDSLELNKVYIHTHHANARNLRVNRSLGFEVEGVLPEEHLLEGSFVDILRMGLLRSSWLERTR